MPSLAYYLAVSAFITHEMDAVRAMEWSLLYVLRALPEKTAYPAFLLGHFPLFFLVLWLGHHENLRLREGFRLFACTFLAIHAGLHARLADHPQNEFEGPISYSLIYLAGFFGGVHLLQLAHRKLRLR